MKSLYAALGLAALALSACSERRVIVGNYICVERNFGIVCAIREEKENCICKGNGSCDRLFLSDEQKLAEPEKRYALDLCREALARD